jgi:nicotinate-nucleotide pyrophosphorylase (carboxylating)
MEFLEEDIGLGDITTNAVVEDEERIEAQIIFKEPAVVAGQSEVKSFLRTLGVNVSVLVEDGIEVGKGTVVTKLEGDARTILSVERTILNLQARMAGIATKTMHIINKIKKIAPSVKIAATRKTAPGLRYFDKISVAIGGGDTHRYGLDDAILIKDNHVIIAGGIDEAIHRVRSKASFTKKIEVEVRNAKEAMKAAKAKVDIIMLDNMSLKEIGRTIQLLEKYGLRNNVLIELSGQITEENVGQYARFNPDVISMGLLTHSIKAIDISLEIVKVN